MNPLLQLENIFQSKKHFEQCFLSQSIKQLNADREEIKELKKKKDTTASDIKYYNYHRSCEFFCDHVKNLSQQAQQQIDESIYNKPKNERFDCADDYLEKISNISDNINALAEKYPEVNPDKYVKSLKYFSEIFDAIKDSRTNSPFATEHLEAMVKIADKIQQLKPNKKLMTFYSPEEILATTLLVCNGEMLRLFGEIYDKYQDLSDDGKETPSQINSEQTKLSLKQIALIYIYEKRAVTRNNGNEIAKDYGHASGEKLFQLYTKFSSRQNRIGLEESEKKNNNRLELFESILPNLSAEAKQWASDEMKTFLASFKSEYE